MLRGGIQLIATVTLSLAVPALPARDDCVYPDCPAYCLGSSKTKPLETHVTIDGNTGEILDGTTTFPERAKVQVIVVQWNPFKYLYQVRTRSQPLDTAIAAQFLGLLQLPSSIVTPAPASVPKGTCTEPQAASWKPITARLSKLMSEYAALLSEANKLPEAITALAAFRNATEGESIPCDKVEDVWKLAEALKPLPDAADLAKSASTLVDDATKLKTDAAAVKSGDDTCDLSQQKAVNDFLMSATTLKTQVDLYNQVKGDYDQIYKRAKTVIATDSPFVRIIYPDTTGMPRGITVEMSRQNLRSTGSQLTSVGTVQITSGEAHLSISAGIGFTTIRERNIIRQASIGDTSDTTVSRFGYDKNSQFRPSAVVQLNGHLWHLQNLLGTGPGSVALSAGLVVSSQAGSTELEYLAGFSLGFLKNLIFLTPAFHAARVPQLAGGFKIGDKVPEGLQDPLPVQKNFRPGFMLSITFKVR
jgi:hypothetical protein